MNSLYTEKKKVNRNEPKIGMLFIMPLERFFVYFLFWFPNRYTYVARQKNKHKKYLYPQNVLDRQK